MPSSEKQDPKGQQQHASTRSETNGLTDPSGIAPHTEPAAQSVDSKSRDEPKHVAQNATAPERDLPDERPVEHGGQDGLEPTRFGDWEKKGRCTDF